MTVDEAGRKRWLKVGKKERAKLMAAASRKFWDSLTPEQRSAEMRRRAKVRARRRKRGNKTL